MNQDQRAGHAFDKLFGEDFFQPKGGNSASVELARLVRENQQLKQQLDGANQTIATLRESKTFYRTNFGKAKAAYEKEVARRQEAEKAASIVEVAALDELVSGYVRAAAEHSEVHPTGVRFMAFSVWRKL